ncbi:MAG: hypothetical protein WAW52_09175 [Methanothrix sp.]
MAAKIHTFVALNLLRPVKLKPRLAEKVARFNRRSNLPDLTLIHGRGMKRHRSLARGRARGPEKRFRQFGRCVRFLRAAVFWLFVELRAGSGRHFAGMGTSANGRCGSALSCLRLAILFP